MSSYGGITSNVIQNSLILVCFNFPLSIFPLESQCGLPTVSPSFFQLSQLLSQYCLPHSPSGEIWYSSPKLLSSS